MTEKNLKKYLLDTTSEIYDSLYVQNITITNNVAEPDSLRGLASAAAIANQQQAALQQVQQ